MRLAHEIRRSMAQSISSLKKLQAFRLVLRKSEAEATALLAKIKNLKHLSVDITGQYYPMAPIDHVFIQSILLSSMSTLRSLSIKTTRYATSFAQDWEKKVSASGVLGEQKHSLTALKSFTLSGCTFDANIIISLDRAIDFMGLHELALGHLSVGRHLLYQHLASLAVSSQINAKCIGLRSLCLRIASYWYEDTPAQTQIAFQALCRFISSFDTLTALELRDCNPHSSVTATGPGLNPILQATFKHKNLKRLKIPFLGIVSGYGFPFLSAASVAAIIDNLPELQDLEFAPDGGDIVGISIIIQSNYTRKTDID